jgi:hypothetical protein
MKTKKEVPTANVSRFCGRHAAHSVAGIVLGVVLVSYWEWYWNCTGSQRGSAHLAFLLFFSIFQQYISWSCGCLSFTDRTISSVANPHTAALLIIEPLGFLSGGEKAPKLVRVPNFPDETLTHVA